MNGRQIIDYTFDSSLKTVTFNEFPSIELGKIECIYNVTRKKMLFSIFSGLAGSVATNVLTLDYDTTDVILFDSADNLIVFYLDTDNIGLLLFPTVELTRPANTTPYAAKDIVSASDSAGISLSLSDAFRKALGTGYLTFFSCRTDNDLIVPRLRIHLYSEQISGNDNAPFGYLYNYRTQSLGYFDLPAFSTEDAGVGDSSFAFRNDLRIAVNNNAGTRNLHFLVETLDAFTPISGQKFYFKAGIDCN
jgi:hypothetical protein